MTRHHDHNNLIKESIELQPGLRFRGLAHCPHGGKHGDKQADMVLET